MVVAILAAAVGAPAVREALPAWVQSARQSGWIGLVVVAALYVPAAVLFVPASLLTLAVGYLFGASRGLVAVSLGSTAGAGVAFLVSRYLLRDSLSARWTRSRWWRALDRAVVERDWFVVIMTRLSPVLPYNVLNYAFGLTGIAFARYLWASWLGMLPGTLLYAFLGSTAESMTRLHPEGAGSSLARWGLVGGLLATVLVTIVLTRAARRNLRAWGIEPEPASKTVDQKD